MDAEYYRRRGGSAAKRGKTLSSVMTGDPEKDSLITQGYERRKRREMKRAFFHAATQAKAQEKSIKASYLRP